MSQPTKSNTQVDYLRFSIAISLVALCPLQTGCLFSREDVVRKVANVANWGPDSNVKVRRTNHDRSWNVFDHYFATKPEPSERTQLLLRKYDLLDRYRDDPEAVIGWLQELTVDEPTMEKVHGLAEIAELQASWLLKQGKAEPAKSLFAVAIIHSYQFLFDPKLDLKRNAYDPQFRSICDIYNRSLEGLLRQVCATGAFQPGHCLTLGIDQNVFEIEVEVAGRWADQEFERFEIVSDYETEGIQNQYHTYGLGVPLIAVRKQQEVAAPTEKYYPPELTLPMTAFCHFEWENGEVNGKLIRAVVKLYDPLERMTVTADGQVVPLESDITTPLAYHLRDPILNSGLLETASLLNAELAPEYYGMYMLEPYDPEKIPVVMVHGFWSSPLTWVRMFNDLRANSDIHKNYQFWFYSYPAGQPFWLSARQMRQDLEQIHRELNPHGNSHALNQMVLVGHSMGGLISTLQTMESDNHFWEMVSDDAIDEFAGDPESIELLRKTFFFSPNPSVRRVVTIASPFQGSEIANQAVRWISQKLFTLPQAEVDPLEQIVKQNGKKLKREFLLASSTSLDSLAPEASVFQAMLKSQVAPDVQYHNILGRVPHRKPLSLPGSEPVFEGDGVVSLESAENPWAESEVVVRAEHSSVHQHPRCIYEVRRILLKNLVELGRVRIRKIPELPVDLDANSKEVQQLERKPVGQYQPSRTQVRESSTPLRVSQVPWESEVDRPAPGDGVWR